MKLLIAYIQPEKLSVVKQNLFDAAIKKMSISNAVGSGQEAGYFENYRGAGTEMNLRKKVRLELAVNDPYVDKAVKAIVDGAKSGKIGDGKVFILDLKECIRIRSNEKGDAAIG